MTPKEELKAKLRDSIDKEKVVRLTAAMVDVFNQEDITTSEACLFITNLFLSVMGTADPQDRWELRTTVLATLMKASVQQDAHMDLHQQPEGIQ